MDKAFSGRTLSFERTVQWADADPAGRINSPRAFDYANEAIEVFFRKEIGISFLELLHEHRLGAPVVHTSCDFASPLLEGEAVTLTLGIERLGNSSVTWRVDAVHLVSGKLVFSVTTVSTIIDLTTGRATPIPPRFREAMEPFLTAS